MGTSELVFSKQLLRKIRQEYSSFYTVQFKVSAFEGLIREQDEILWTKEFSWYTFFSISFFNESTGCMGY